VEGSGFMSGLTGEETNGAQTAEGAGQAASSPSPSSSPSAATANTGAAGDATTAGTGGRPRGARIRTWFGALLRSLFALVLTLVVLAVFGGVIDVVLHVTRHTSTSSTTYSGVDAVMVVLDGDISLSVLGSTRDGTRATLAAVDTSTPFDDPVRTDDVIGGTLYLTERCPDTRCTASLTLTVNAGDAVDVVAGNGLRLGNAVVEFEGITGPASVKADPAKLIVVDTVVTGAVIGEVQCDTTEDCRGVATVSGR
jgi:hypothetical protein